MEAFPLMRKTRQVCLLSLLFSVLGFLANTIRQKRNNRYKIRKEKTKFLFVDCLHRKSKKCTDKLLELIFIKVVEYKVNVQKQTYSLVTIRKKCHSHHLFMWIWVNCLVSFNFNPKYFPFSISCRAGLLVTDFLSLFIWACLKLSPSFEE